MTTGLPSTREIVVDCFAGGGGASTGIETALGRSPDVALNHDPIALAIHMANHPKTKHVCQDIWQASPRWVTQGRAVGLLWASPDCTDHSKAKGGPVKRNGKTRDLPWAVWKWASEVRPRIIIVENVEEMQQWGPLNGEGQPIKERRGESFKAWVKALRRLGYTVQWRELRACDYGAPTIRKRMYLIARCDGRPIVWPEPTHGPKGANTYRTAAEIIDWSIPCPSIFERKKPLAEATQRRIAEGIRRYVLEAAEPFIVGCGGRMAQSRPRSADEPFQTITSKADSCLVTPYVIKLQQNSVGQPLGEPLHTVMAGAARFGLVTAFLAQHNGGPNNERIAGRSALQPLSTVTTKGSQQQLVTANLTRFFGNSVGQPVDDPAPTTTAGGGGKTGLVTSHLVKLRGTCKDGQDVREPMPTVTSGGLHVGEVRAFLVKYYGEGGQWQGCNEPVHTVTTKDRLGLVTVTINGEPYVIADIGMRMLSPRELARAQGFPESYILDPIHNGKPLTKTAQVRAVGNSVCPDVAAALVRANYQEQAVERVVYRGMPLMAGAEG